MLTTYNGQKALLREEIEHRCAGSDFARAMFGRPLKVRDAYVGIGKAGWLKPGVGAVSSVGARASKLWSSSSASCGCRHAGSEQSTRPICHELLQAVACCCLTCCVTDHAGSQRCPAGAAPGSTKRMPAVNHGGQADPQELMLAVILALSYRPMRAGHHSGQVPGPAERHRAALPGSHPRCGPRTGCQKVCCPVLDAAFLGGRHLAHTLSLPHLIPSGCTRLQHMFWQPATSFMPCNIRNFDISGCEGIKPCAASELSFTPAPGPWQSWNNSAALLSHLVSFEAH